MDPTHSKYKDPTRLNQPIKSWRSLISRQQRFEATSEEWVFRGHRDNRWKLETSFERAVKDFRLEKQNPRDLEVKLIVEFVRHYHLHTHEAPPQPGDTLDWLALMRHHGAPSRLLDFTFSFLVAAYFALEDPPPEEPRTNPAVWAVNKSWLTRAMWKWADKSGHRRVFRKLAQDRNGAVFRKLFLEKHAKAELVATIGPFRRNERLRAQNGIFLCPGHVESSFDRILNNLEGHEAGVIEVPIIVGSKKRLEILKQLGKIGVDRAALFPGIDGFAQSLRTKLLLFSELQELEESGARYQVRVRIDSLAER